MGAGVALSQDGGARGLRVLCVGCCACIVSCMFVLCVVVSVGRAAVLHNVIIIRQKTTFL